VLIWNVINGCTEKKLVYIIIYCNIIVYIRGSPGAYPGIFQREGVYIFLTCKKYTISGLHLKNFKFKLCVVGSWLQALWLGSTYSLGELWHRRANQNKWWLRILSINILFCSKCKTFHFSFLCIIITFYIYCRYL